jgi:alanine dehydrogenase
MANNGLEKAIAMDKGLANGVNIYCGKCTNKNVATSLDLEYVKLEDVLN